MENVFEDLPTPTAACFGNASGLAATRCELVSLNTGRYVAKMKEIERDTQNFAIPTPRFVWKFSPWNPPSHARRTIFLHSAVSRTS